MKPIQAIFRLHVIDGKSSLLIFWGILLAIFALSYGLVTFLSGGSVQFSGAPSVYIYSFVIGIVSVKETLFFSLGMGQRRTDYVAGTLLYFLGSAVVSATLLTAFSRLETWILGWKQVPVSFFATPWISDQPALVEWLFHTGTILLLSLFGFFLSSVYFRFGMIGMFGLSAIGLLIITLLRLIGGFTALEQLYDGLDPATGITATYLFFIVLHSTLSYFLLRRVTVK